MRRINGLLALVLSAAACGVAVAQDQASANHTGATAKSEERYYKLTFRVIATGSDGVPLSSRTYSQVITADHLGQGGRPSEIRTGDKVPVATGSSTGENVVTQFQYLDIGTEIDTLNATDNDGALQAIVTARVSSVAAPKASEQNSALGHQPVIRECRWNSKVTVPIGKPTTIFSSDNPSDKGKTELELTATPIK